MAKDNYWVSREAINQNIKADKELSIEINKKIERLQNELNREIDLNMRRYAAKENIDVSEAYARADKIDVKAFEEKAKQYVKEKNFSKQANYELRLYNLTMRVSRLELIKSILGLEMIATFNDIERVISEYMETQAYEELKRQAGILGETVYEGYATTLEKIVNGSFKYAKFSDRIWKYQAELKAELDKLLSKQLVGGHNSRVIAAELRKIFDVTKNQAERLIRTESSRIQVEVQRDTYERYGVEKYVYIAETTACDICAKLDDKQFYVKDMQPGVNATPLHPNCKCTVAPVNNREQMLKDFDARGLYKK